MKRLCICKICSCGAHRCRHLPTALHMKGNKTWVQTEYEEKYPAYGGHRPPKSLKPQPVDPGYRGKMDGTTTFRANFIPYKVARRQCIRPVDEYKPKQVEIDMETTYTQDFISHEVQTHFQVRPKERVHAVAGKLDTVPTYTEDFKPWEICKRELAKPDLSYHPPPDRFDSTTTFQDDYVSKGLATRQSMKPHSDSSYIGGTFDGLTNHQLSYVQHPLEARYVRPPVEYRPSSQPLQDMTTQRSDFQGLPAQRARSCKPDPVKEASSGPFESLTEFQESYQQWPVSLTQQHKPVEHSSPTGTMDMSTTTGTDYVTHNVQPYISAKPIKQPPMSSEPFQGCTTMSADFQPWVTKRQVLIKKPDQEIQRASGKMEDLTTFMAAFTPHELRPIVSFKPAHTPMEIKDPLDCMTTYNAEFLPKRVSVCPASLISPPGFELEGSDDSGHMFFRKL